MKRSITINGIAVIVIFLIIVGLIVDFLNNPVTFLLPFIVIGGLFLLFKYPPATWRKPNNNAQQPRYYTPPKATKNNKATRSKTVPFRVIEGNKKDDEDDTPKYH